MHEAAYSGVICLFIKFMINGFEQGLLACYTVCAVHFAGAAEAVLSAQRPSFSCFTFTGGSAAQADRLNTHWRQQPTPAPAKTVPKHLGRGAAGGRGKRGNTVGFKRGRF